MKVKTKRKEEKDISLRQKYPVLKLKSKSFIRIMPLTLPKEEEDGYFYLDAYNVITGGNFTYKLYPTIARNFLKYLSNNGFLKNEQYKTLIFTICCANAKLTYFFVEPDLDNLEGVMNKYFTDAPSIIRKEVERYITETKVKTTRGLYKKLLLKFSADEIAEYCPKFYDAVTKMSR